MDADEHSAALPQPKNIYLAEPAEATEIHKILSNIFLNSFSAFSVGSVRFIKKQPFCVYLPPLQCWNSAPGLLCGGILPGDPAEDHGLSDITGPLIQIAPDRAQLAGGI
jgi:hypothetical protein